MPQSDELDVALLGLKRPDSPARISALDTIGTLNPAGGVGIILPFLSDPDPEVRVAAACNLGDLGDGRAIPHLIQTARGDPEEKVRGEALAALAPYRSAEVLACLIAEVDRPKRSRRPRQEVAKQLGNYTAETAADALVDLMADEDAFVREYAAESLFRQNRPRLLTVWRGALSDLSPHVRRIAGEASKALGHEPDGETE
jgi:HEAT repeat protein